MPHEHEGTDGVVVLQAKEPPRQPAGQQLGESMEQILHDSLSREGADPADTRILDF